MQGDFWENVLGKPRLVVAPMVDASELAWRLLSRRHGAQLCYTPMLHSCVFIQQPRYRSESLQSAEGDRPLIVQFCGNDPDILLQAAKLAEPHCDAIDINIGCPQAIAKRGHYGAFLQDEWSLLSRIVSTLRMSLRVPVTCKIRIYEDIDKTVEYAKMLESAGCQLLSVHGRTKEQKGPLTGLASWDHIKAVKENVSIPVFANGNIQCLQDVDRCISFTKCDGIMSAEGNLYNPAIFEGRYPPSWEMALEYLELVEKYPCPLSYMRGHLFKIFHHILSLPENKDARSDLASNGSVEEFRKVANTIRDRYEPYHEGRVVWKEGYSDSYDLVLPPWLCKPYVRPPPEDHLRKMQELRNNEAKANEDGNPAKRPRAEDGTVMSKKMCKKLQKHPEKINQVRRTVVICSSPDDCPNPMGLKCDFSLCKTCCRTKCYQEDLDCPGHGILIKSRREKAKLFGSKDSNNGGDVTATKDLEIPSR
ncbi:UNVERIFIED_CONTAM: hypothetical protein PYX00_005256 [Menopon gallinae]|uniref:tRNA-dihydrouridine(16/17) synthase [NAD(P)(+)]-like n=1 Tax=Menopon gallinae TaxID=328185 RepID=A0AAW2HRC5_9NEOP